MTRKFSGYVPTSSGMHEDPWLVYEISKGAVVVKERKQTFLVNFFPFLYPWKVTSNILISEGMVFEIEQSYSQGCGWVVAKDGNKRFLFGLKIFGSADECLQVLGQSVP